MLLTSGVFIPAAAQSNAFTGGAGAEEDGISEDCDVEESGLIASQTVHLEAVCGFDKPHKPQFQFPFVLVGCFMPAPAKSKGLTIGSEGAGTVPNMFVVGTLGNLVSEKELNAGALALFGSVEIGFGILVSKGFVEFIELKSKAGSEETGTAFASL